MKKFRASLLAAALFSCLAVPSLAEAAQVLIVPGEHQWICQGDKLTFTAHWESSAPLEALQWLMDGAVVKEHPLFGQSEGVSHFSLYGADYAVKTFPDGQVSSYELGCRLVSAESPAAPAQQAAWDEVVVYVCPPDGQGSPETPMDVPPEITSLSWHLVTDALGDEYLGIEIAWTPVEGATGYEVFGRVGSAGDFLQQTETIETSVLAGFALPMAETMYYVKVRATQAYTDPDTAAPELLNGPFSAVASITVPAQDAPAWHTLWPMVTLPPHYELLPGRIPGLLIPDSDITTLVTPAPGTLRPSLRTDIPIRPAVTVRPLATPSPSPMPLLPIQTMRIPPLRP